MQIDRLTYKPGHTPGSRRLQHLIKWCYTCAAVLESVTLIRIVLCVLRTCAVLCITQYTVEGSQKDAEILQCDCTSEASKGADITGSAKATN